MRRYLGYIRGLPISQISRQTRETHLVCVHSTCSIEPLDAASHLVIIRIDFSEPHSALVHRHRQKPKSGDLRSLKMPNYFRITLMRSAIGLPRKTSGVLKALGLHKRLRTVYHPVSPDVAGQIFAVKELVDVQEVDQALTKNEMKELRRPDPGFYVEKRAMDVRLG